MSELNGILRPAHPACPVPSRPVGRQRRLETLGQMLADKGHSATRIEKILGRNLLRVFSDVWHG